MVPQDMLWFFIDGQQILECGGDFYSNGGVKIIVRKTFSTTGTPHGLVQGVFDEISIVLMLPASQSVITNYTTALVCIHMNLFIMTVID